CADLCVVLKEPRLKIGRWQWLMTHRDGDGKRARRRNFAQDCNVLMKKIATSYAGLPKLVKNSSDAIFCRVLGGRMHCPGQSAFRGQSFSMRTTESPGVLKLAKTG